MSREEDFFKLHYTSLREEIKEAKSRAFNILKIGFTVLPAAQALGVKLESNAFIIVVPFLIITFALIFLAENHSIMRCGRFIRTYIEHSVDAVPGWERYLEQQRGKAGECHNTRSVDQFTIYAFFLLFLIYYILSMVMALAWLVHVGEPQLLICTLGLLYTVVGIFFGGFLNTNLQKATSTEAETKIDTVFMTAFGHHYHDISLKLQLMKQKILNRG